jgi:hypothetical protein
MLPSDRFTTTGWLTELCIYRYPSAVMGCKHAPIDPPIRPPLQPPLLVNTRTPPPTIQTRTDTPQNPLPTQQTSKSLNPLLKSHSNESLKTKTRAHGTLSRTDGTQVPHPEPSQHDLRGKSVQARRAKPALPHCFVAHQTELVVIVMIVVVSSTNSSIDSSSETSSMVIVRNGGREPVGRFRISAWDVEDLDFWAGREGCDCPGG